MAYPDNARIELAKFLHGPEGQFLIAHLRANPPVSPIPVDTAMGVHHVQINYGFTLGIDARLKQLIDLAESKAKPPEPEAPRLHDTKQLSPT
jgi:hypothetical protein